MSKNALLLFIVLGLASIGFAQPADAKKDDKTAPAAAAEDRVTMELAKATVAAHGGEKLRALRSMLWKGSVDMNVMGQTMPGAYSTAFKGEKYYFELISPAQQLKQVFDGERTSTSVQGFYLPPAASIGFPVLARIGDAGYVVSAPKDARKKGKAFRVTTPDGYFTDFTVDEKTKQIKRYESSYDMGGGRVVTTSVEIDSFETVDGILAPKKYSQRFDLGTITAYAAFNAKTILINKAIEDSAFTVSN